MAVKKISTKAYLITNVVGKGNKMDAYDGECVVFQGTSPENAISEYFKSNDINDATDCFWVAIPCEEIKLYTAKERPGFDIVAES